MLEICEESLSDELKKTIYQGFAAHAIAQVGADGDMRVFTFVAKENAQFQGAVVCKTFWGALHVKYLYLIPAARKKGIGRELMKNALQRAKDLNCRFAFVETMSFQALAFYKKLGFIEEFARSGYANGCSFHYLRKDF